MDDTTEHAGHANLPIGALRIANREIGVPWGWHSRGYLPHYDSAVATQHVTFHLADSLPKDVVCRLEDELVSVPPERHDAERRKRVEAWMDAGHGTCVLRDPTVARQMEETLQFFDAQRYRLLAWTVMPNHVHVLFRPQNGWTVAKTVASWKKRAATQICAFRRSSPGNANLRIGVIPAPVWHREYWDRFIRDERHFQQVVDYIHQNPVKAGLVARAEDWPWGSARFCGANVANQEIGVPGHANLPIGDGTIE